MAWEPRPVPTPTPETAPYWAAAAEGRLVLNECRDCGLIYHYPRALCPDCFSEDVDWIDASGRGDVYSYTVAHQAPGWPEDDLPLVLAFVELEEGPRMPTVIRDCDPADVEVGMAVTVDFVGTERDDVAIPVFGPA